MEIPVKTLKSGLSMPVFGLGTWSMGGTTQRDPRNNDEADVAAIRRAIDAGVTHIDTAEMYADGHAENLVCEAIKGYAREKLFIVSKVSPWNLRISNLRKSCEASLRRLGIDQLDLYLIHKPDPATPIEETMGVMNRLVDDGLVKHIGISNFSVKRSEDARRASKHPIVANQLHLNLKFRETEQNGLLEDCVKNDQFFIAWRPIDDLQGMADVPIMQEMCEKYDKTPAQIAINWLIAQPNVITLAKMRSPEHLAENLGAVGWTMELEDVEKLRGEFPDQKAVSDAVPLI